MSTDTNALAYELLDPAEQGIPADSFGAPASPLQVTIRPVSGVEVDVSAEAFDVEWADRALGGYGDGQISLPRGFWENQPWARAWADVVIRDGAYVVYEGRIEDVARDRYTITLGAQGWQRHASDDVYRGLRADRRLRRWRLRVLPDDASPALENARLRRQRTDARGPELLVTNPFDDDSPPVVAAGERVTVRYKVPASWSGGIKKLQFLWKASGSTVNRQLRVRSFLSTGAYTDHYSADWTTTPQTVEIADFPDDTREVAIQAMYFPAALNVINKGNVRIWGPDLRGPTVWVGIDDGRAHRVVREVARVACPHFDRSGVKATTPIVDELDFTEPVEPAAIFTEMLLFAPTNVDDPEWTWWVRERLSNGLRRFAFEPLPNSVAYDTAVAADVTQDHGDVYNRCVVQYLDSEGFSQDLVRTRTVAELDEAGLIRTLPAVNIGQASDLKAQRVGDMLLALHRQPARGGTVTVRDGDVRDAKTGAELPYHLILPGRWIRLAGSRVAGRIPKQAGQHDVFLITEVRGSRDRREATLSFERALGSVEQILARHEQLLRRPRPRTQPE